MAIVTFSHSTFSSAKAIFLKEQRETISDVCLWQLTLHKVGPGLQPPHDLALLHAIHPSVLTVPHVGRAGFIWREHNGGLVSGLTAQAKTATTVSLVCALPKNTSSQNSLPTTSDWKDKHPLAYKQGGGIPLFVALSHTD